MQFKTTACQLEQMRLMHILYGVVFIELAVPEKETGE